MLFLKQFRLQFLSFIRNDFSGVESGNSTPDNQTPQNAHDLITQILSDGRLNGEDLSDLKSLKDIIEAGESQIYSDTREGLNSLVLDTLKNGYSVSNEKDYLALKKMLFISGSDLELPEYDVLLERLRVGKFSLTLNHQGDGFFVYNQESFLKLQIGHILGGKLYFEYGTISDISGSHNQIGSLDDNLLSSLISSTPAPTPELAVEQLNERARRQEAYADHLRGTREDSLRETPEPEPTPVDQEQARRQEAYADHLRGAREDSLREAPEQLSNPEFEKAKRFYERMGANEFSIEGLQAALILNGEELPIFGADGSFGKETFEAVKSFQSKNGLTVDGMAGSNTLKELGIVENPRDFYSRTSNPEVSETGNSEEIGIPESETSSENNEKSSRLGNLSNSLNERFVSIKKWVGEVFKSNPDVGEFIGGNGRTIKLSYNQEKNIIHVNTPFFDGVSDFPLSDIPENIDSLESAQNYVKGKIEEIKKNYDEQVLRNSMARLSSNRTDSQNNSSTFYKIDNFTFNDKLIDISLYNGNFLDGTDGKNFLKVNTSFGDKVRQREVTIEINDINDITEINSKTQELKERYKKIFQERNK